MKKNFKSWDFTPALINHYWRAHVESYAEMQFIIASVFMECLKFDWAKNVATNIYQPRIGANHLIKGFQKINSRHQSDASFEELLVGLSNHVGFPAQMTVWPQGSNPGQPGTFTFIDNRNALFHTGQSGAAQLNHPNVLTYLKPETKKLLDQMDDLLLRILSYNGPIVRRSNPNRVVQFP